MPRFRQCANKDCDKYGKLYDLSEHQCCPSCGGGSKGFTKHNGIVVGLKAASKGAIATYEPTGDYYMDMLFKHAQENLI